MGYSVLTGQKANPPVSVCDLHVDLTVSALLEAMREGDVAEVILKQGGGVLLLPYGLSFPSASVAYDWIMASAAKRATIEERSRREALAKELRARIAEAQRRLDDIENAETV